MKESEDERRKIFEFGPGEVGGGFGYWGVNGREKGKVLFEVRDGTISLLWACHRDVFE